MRAGPDGLLHVRRGSPQTRFMPGLWGTDAAGGGPGSIWKIDGVSEAVTLFANVTLDDAPNSGPALGGLAFDPVSNSLLVADRETGMIHSFGMNGMERAAAMTTEFRAARHKACRPFNSTRSGSTLEFAIRQ